MYVIYIPTTRLIKNLNILQNQCSNTIMLFLSNYILGQFTVPLKEHLTSICCLCLTYIEHSKFLFDEINFIRLALMLESVYLLSNFKVILLSRDWNTLDPGPTCTPYYIIIMMIKVIWLYS